LCVFPTLAFSADVIELKDSMSHCGGLVCVIIFCFAYSLVIVDEQIHLRKSKPVMVVAGVIWIVAVLIYA